MHLLPPLFYYIQGKEHDEFAQVGKTRLGRPSGFRGPMAKSENPGLVLTGQIPQDNRNEQWSGVMGKSKTN